jgi:uncharacterized protein (DUF1330 family)
VSKGYFFAEIEITDPAAYEEYRSRTMATLEKYGGRYIVRGGDPALVEGTILPGRIVVAEFPTPERAREWYNSPEYQAILPLRLRTSKGRALFLTGS